MIVGNYNRFLMRKRAIFGDGISVKQSVQDATDKAAKNTTAATTAGAKAGKALSDVDWGSLATHAIAPVGSMLAGKLIHGKNFNLRKALMYGAGGAALDFAVNGWGGQGGWGRQAWNDWQNGRKQKAQEEADRQKREADQRAYNDQLAKQITDGFHSPEDVEEYKRNHFGMLPHEYLNADKSVIRQKLKEQREIAARTPNLKQKLKQEQADVDSGKLSLADTTEAARQAYEEEEARVNEFLKNNKAPSGMDPKEFERISKIKLNTLKGHYQKLVEKDPWFAQDAAQEKAKRARNADAKRRNDEAMREYEAKEQADKIAQARQADEDKRKQQEIQADAEDLHARQAEDVAYQRGQREEEAKAAQIEQARQAEAAENAYWAQDAAQEKAKRARNADAKRRNDEAMREYEAKEANPAASGDDWAVQQEQSDRSTLELAKRIKKKLGVSSEEAMKKAHELIEGGKLPSVEEVRREEEADRIKAEDAENAKRQADFIKATREADQGLQSDAKAKSRSDANKQGQDIAREIMEQNRTPVEGFDDIQVDYPDVELSAVPAPTVVPKDVNARVAWRQKKLMAEDKKRAERDQAEAAERARIEKEREARRAAHEQAVNKKLAEQRARVEADDARRKRVNKEYRDKVKASREAARQERISAEKGAAEQELQKVLSQLQGTSDPQRRAALVQQAQELQMKLGM